MEAKHKARIARVAGVVAVATAMLFTPPSALAEDQTFYLGSAVNAGCDTGYSETNDIKESDPHFGWQLGSFSITGYTAVQRDGESFTFIKNVGDKVALNFRLEQDIDRLNNNEALSIANDENGYDQELGVEKSEPGFGRGTLIVRQVNYQNEKSDNQVYNDYLSGVTAGADTQVQLFEEGDYEVVLDYEIKKDARKVGGVWVIPSVSILPEYSNYTIRIKFSVRNGNTIAFLFDARSGSELTNSSTAPNGFKIDMAQSHYLSINVKREVLSGNSFDVRSNAPAEDGEEYTEEGVYTITTTNPTTSQTTQKIIYVGNDPQLKAYAVTGYTLDQIRDMVSQGATISDEGNIEWPDSSTAAATGTASASGGEAAATKTKQASDTSMNLTPFVLGAAAVVVVAGVAVAKKKRAAAPKSSVTELPAIGLGGDVAPTAEDEAIEPEFEDGDGE